MKCKQSAQFTLLLSCMMITGCAGAWSQVPAPARNALEDLRETQSADPNQQLISNAHSVVMGLEQYAVDQAGSYPPAATLIKDLTGDYLTSHRFPRNPFSTYELHQSNVILLSSGNRLLNRVGEGKPTPVGTVLGPGKAPFNSTFDLTTYGALIYDYEPRSRRYYLYAIGQQGTDAVVKGAFSNL